MHTIVATLAVALAGAPTLGGCDPGPSAPIDAGLPAPDLGSAPEPAAASAHVPNVADPGALGELLAMAPKKPRPTTAPDGGTTVGSDTGVPGVPTMPIPRAETGPGIEALPPTVQPQLSSPAIERAARAQIYWKLAKACRGPDGKAPPPEVVTLLFTIRPDGTVEPASVQASASEPRYQKTAECALREFSALPFRGPEATRGDSTPVIITWPSVD